MIDKENFCEHIRQQENAMYSLAFSVVKNDADAAEIISESIFRAYRKIDTLKNENAFKPWILRIVHNTAVEFVRKNAKIVSMETIDLVDEDVENHLLTTISLQEAVKSLKQPYRTVITLYYYEDFSIAQIAKITDTSMVTVKQRLFRARKQLREILKEGFENESI
ncbi:MAG: RNA polymerase sigma factor [Lachnospiraceae bacterium]|nr:RNA polymerase sigma factor [Lachnospiraceae bacterium]